jgi:hypothetical protein
MALSKPAKFLTILILLLAAYLAGLLPAYVERRTLSSQIEALQTRLSDTQAKLEMASLRNDLAMILVDVEQNNFGVARDRSTLFFDRLRQVIPSVSDEQVRQHLSAMLGQRDAVTSDLTSVNPESPARIRKLFVEFPQLATN